MTEFAGLRVAPEVVVRLRGTAQAHATAPEGGSLAHGLFLSYSLDVVPGEKGWKARLE